MPLFPIRIPWYFTSISYLLSVREIVSRCTHDVQTGTQTARRAAHRPALTHSQAHMVTNVLSHAYTTTQPHEHVKTNPDALVTPALTPTSIPAHVQQTVPTV